MINGLLVKVCGMTRPEDARLCAELGADLLGFIFHPKSPRNTTPELPAVLDFENTRKVGVFLDQTPDEVLRLMGAGRLDMAQLHGGQDEDFCIALTRVLKPEQIIKVVWPEKMADPLALQAELDRFAPYCRMFLADAGSGGGGHGRTITSDALANAVFQRPLLLAGGLGPHNIAAMLSRFLPRGVDLNSGVESAPGIKDEQLLRAAFAAIEAARAAQTQGVTP